MDPNSFTNPVTVNGPMFVQNPVILGALIFVSLALTSCTRKNPDLYGTWRVIGGRNAGAVFEFSNTDRLYIYGDSVKVQTFWYGFTVKSNKPLNGSNYLATPYPTLGKLNVQGEITWESGSKIKFWPESKTSDSEIAILEGPLYIITESSKGKLKLDEMQSEMKQSGGSEYRKVGEMTLVPYK